MEDPLLRCDQCNSPVTDSIEVEIENHGRVKFGKYTRGSWMCNDCMAERADETNSIMQDDSNITYHEHITSANKSDVSPNTPLQMNRRYNLEILITPHCSAGLVDVQL